MNKENDLTIFDADLRAFAAQAGMCMQNRLLNTFHPVFLTSLDKTIETYMLDNLEPPPMCSWEELWFPKVIKLCSPIPYIRLAAIRSSYYTQYIMTLGNWNGLGCYIWRTYYYSAKAVLKRRFEMEIIMILITRIRPSACDVIH